MRILLTNDDGIGSRGLAALVRVLGERHEIYVIAPTTQRSATGHGISVHAPITYSRLFSDDCKLRISADGTPADCVKMAVLHFMKDCPPDLVVSGVNEGPNVGSDVIYSGTVSAALEGAYLGLPSIAVSNVARDNAEGYELAARLVSDKLDDLLSLGLPAYTALNINYPSARAKGIKIVRAAINHYSDRYSEVDERSLGISGEPISEGMDEDTDVAQIAKGSATVTPITLDRNDHAFLSVMKRNMKLE